jgi:4'-phosphopantetheinyl transferase
LVSIRANTVEIWKASVPALVPHFPQFRAWLSPDELERAGRYHFDRDRHSFLVSRGGLRWLLSRYLGVQPSDLKFEYSAYGRPHVVSPAPGTLRFNVSHSGEMVVYAFAHELDVGIDVEHVRPIDDVLALAERFFSPDERDFLRALPDAARLRSFFTCWVRKEAYIKAIGTGLSTPLDRFSVSIAEDRAAMLEIEGSAGKAAAWKLHPLEMESGYVGALAVHSRSVVVGQVCNLQADLQSALGPTASGTGH